MNIKNCLQHHVEVLILTFPDVVDLIPTRVMKLKNTSSMNSIGYCMDDECSCFHSCFHSPSVIAVSIVCSLVPIMKNCFGYPEAKTVTI